MPITRLKAPTLDEIATTIRSLERQFNVTSGKFQSSKEIYASIPEDAAAEWTYALEQYRVLNSSAERYWKTVSGSQTPDHRETDRCDYAASVAA